ncbi:MAG TPA: aminoglycoside phosphotransferase family protein [Candidatus Lumbricidophila sp.]|nr:aminoglycoside phosphotransferase family protein [Candidatus Lumbricidophila sp.]
MADGRSDASDAEALGLLEHLGLIAAGDRPKLTALIGGVSSDIWVVDDGSRTYVLKHAREQLKVAADWHAPVDRGEAEAAWLAFVAEHVPGAAPTVLAYDEETFAIALEFLDPAKFANWKTLLLSGTVDVAFAGAVGRSVGRIHAASAATPGLAEQFANQELFEALRIEPYLQRTAAAVAEASDAVNDVIAGLRATQVALVHGDMSPKNILVGDRPVILDAECATWGDPAFDAAFCLNHLVMKAIHLPDHRVALLDAAAAFMAAYLAEVNWEAPDAIEARIDRVLPALLLARVAGASPAEYLTADDQAVAKRVAIESLNSGRRVIEILVGA